MYKVQTASNLHPVDTSSPRGFDVLALGSCTIHMCSSSPSVDPSMHRPSSIVVHHEPTRRLYSGHRGARTAQHSTAQHSTVQYTYFSRERPCVRVRVRVCVCVHVSRRDRCVPAQAAKEKKPKKNGTFARGSTGGVLLLAADRGLGVRYLLRCWNLCCIANPPSYLCTIYTAQRGAEHTATLISVHRPRLSRELC